MGYLNILGLIATHQRCQPFKDIDRLPIIDKVGLSTLKKKKDKWTINTLYIIWVQYCNLKKRNLYHATHTATKAFSAVRASAAKTWAITKLSTCTQFILALGSPKQKLNNLLSTFTWEEKRIIKCCFCILQSTDLHRANNTL